jgi:hypothetical protein
MNPTRIIDIPGIYGSMLHYMLVIAFVGSAFMIFIYLWHKGRLDMDEEPKLQMMRDDEDEKTKDEYDRRK